MHGSDDDTSDANESPTAFSESDGDYRRGKGNWSLNVKNTQHWDTDESSTSDADSGDGDSGDGDSGDGDSGDVDGGDCDGDGDGDEGEPNAIKPRKKPKPRWVREEDLLLMRTKVALGPVTTAEVYDAYKAALVGTRYILRGKDAVTQYYNKFDCKVEFRNACEAASKRKAWTNDKTWLQAEDDLVRKLVQKLRHQLGARGKTSTGDFQKFLDKMLTAYYVVFTEDIAKKMAKLRVKHHTRTIKAFRTRMMAFQLQTAVAAQASVASPPRTNPPREYPPELSQPSHGAAPLDAHQTVKSGQEGSSGKRPPEQGRRSRVPECGVAGTVEEPQSSVMVEATVMAAGEPNTTVDSAVSEGGSRDSSEEHGKAKAATTSGCGNKAEQTTPEEKSDKDLVFMRAIVRLGPAEDAVPVHFKKFDTVAEFINIRSSIDREKWTVDGTWLRATNDTVKKLAQKLRNILRTRAKTASGAYERFSVKESAVFRDILMRDMAKLGVKYHPRSIKAFRMRKNILTDVAIHPPRRDPTGPSDSMAPSVAKEAEQESSVSVCPQVQGSPGECMSASPRKSRSHGIAAATIPLDAPSNGGKRQCENDGDTEACEVSSPKRLRTGGVASEPVVTEKAELVLWPDDRATGILRRVVAQLVAHYVEAEGDAQWTVEIAEALSLSHSADLSGALVEAARGLARKLIALMEAGREAIQLQATKAILDVLGLCTMRDHAAHTKEQLDAQLRAAEVDVKKEEELAGEIPENDDEQLLDAIKTILKKLDSCFELTQEIDECEQTTAIRLHIAETNARPQEPDGAVLKNGKEMANTHAQSKAVLLRDINGPRLVDIQLAPLRQLLHDFQRHNAELLYHESDQAVAHAMKALYKAMVPRLKELQVVYATRRIAVDEFIAQYLMVLCGVMTKYFQHHVEHQKVMETEAKKVRDEMDKFKGNFHNMKRRNKNLAEINECEVLIATSRDKLAEAVQLHRRQWDRTCALTSPQVLTTMQELYASLLETLPGDDTVGAAVMALLSSVRDQCDIRHQEASRTEDGDERLSNAEPMEGIESATQDETLMQQEPPQTPRAQEGGAEQESPQQASPPARKSWRLW